MKVHKIELMIVDEDDVGEIEIRSIIEDSSYPNHCIAPKIMTFITKEVDWEDSHPLNKNATCDEAYQKLFT
jgi:hypothetical protein